MSNDNTLIPFGRFLRARARQAKPPDVKKVAAGAELCDQFGEEGATKLGELFPRLAAKIEGGEFQGWNTPTQMLEDVVADIKADTVQPTAAFAILYSPASGIQQQRTPFYSMGLSRIELIGLLTLALQMIAEPDRKTPPDANDTA